MTIKKEELLLRVNLLFMVILAIDTSCDETSAAVVAGRRVLANVIYSQILLHHQWGGVVPSIAKKAHEEKIDYVINEVLDRFKRNNKGKAKIDAVAVTQGPGLAVALEVGIKKAKELAKKYSLRLISVNHLEGHLYSPFVQNRQGNPNRAFSFPYLSLIVSGGHTELVIFQDHLKYKVIGSTLDDAAGEALDKAGKLLGLGYPAGPVIEKLAIKVKNKDYYHFPRPMINSEDLNFSFSGLKTAFYYFLKKMPEEQRIKNISFLASSFQEAVFETLVKKTAKAIETTGIKKITLVGGVAANLYLKKKFRELARKYQGEVLFPSFKYLSGDNAAMIGVAASFKAKNNFFVENLDSLDRIPRMKL